MALTLSLGLMHSLASGSGVHAHGSLHDKSVLVEFANVLSYRLKLATLFVRFKVSIFIIFNQKSKLNREPVTSSLWRTR